MMKRAGYIQLNRRPVIDEDGIPRDVIEIHVCSTRFCIRISELRCSLQSGSPARVEKLKWNWMAYIGGVAGFARISKSGKALNVDLANGERFTVARDALQAVLGQRERFASVAVLPPQLITTPVRNRLLTDYYPHSSFEGYNLDEGRRVPA
jgi:hypothetical protein